VLSTSIIRILGWFFVNPIQPRVRLVFAAAAMTELKEICALCKSVSGGHDESISRWVAGKLSEAATICRFPAAAWFEAAVKPVLVVRRVVLLSHRWEKMLLVVGRTC
jgi:hypothetical protein